MKRVSLLNEIHPHNTRAFKERCQWCRPAVNKAQGAPYVLAKSIGGEWLPMCKRCFNTRVKHHSAVLMEFKPLEQREG